jgi:hypothetical protein
MLAAYKRNFLRIGNNIWKRKENIHQLKEYTIPKRNMLFYTDIKAYFNAESISRDKHEYSTVI